MQPVFETMLENAVRICDAKFGNLWLREGDAFSIGATHGAPQAYVDYLRRERVFHADRGWDSVNSFERNRRTKLPTSLSHQRTRTNCA